MKQVVNMLPLKLPRSVRYAGLAEWNLVVRLRRWRNVTRGRSSGWLWGWLARRREIGGRWHRAGRVIFYVRLSKLSSLDLVLARTLRMQRQLQADQEEAALR